MHKIIIAIVLIIIIFFVLDFIEVRSGFSTRLGLPMINDIANSVYDVTWLPTLTAIGKATGKTPLQDVIIK